MASLSPVTSDDRDPAHPLDDEGAGPRSSSSPDSPEPAASTETSTAASTETSTATEGTGERAGKQRRKRKQLPLWQETILLLSIALVLAFVIKAFFLQAFYIPSVSMEPGLQVNDRILVQKVSYWGGNSPQRGDVVVFEDPGTWLNDPAADGPSNPVTQVMARIGLYPTGGHLVKRVIGIEGDVVQCCDEEGRILVNGEPLDEPYIVDQPLCNGPELDADACNRGLDGWETVPVPEGHMFVMGDNRGQSEDSVARMCQPLDTNECVPGPEFVDTDLVVGKVFALVWPRQHWDWITRPDETFADVPDPS